MTQSTVSGFFTGGGKGITWPETPGKDGGRVSVTGTITAVHPPEPVLDPKTGQPTDRQQVRIDLSTDERDPQADFDDGARTLYVKSYMRSAVGEALRRIGEKEPKVGGKLLVRFVRIEPPARPGLSPSKIFEAQYQPPAVTGDYFNGGQPQQPAQQPPAAQWPVGGGFANGGPVQPPAQTGPARPANIPEAAWNTMDPATRAAVAAAQPAALVGPTKPATIPQAAWDAMSPTDQANVAASMAQIPGPPV